MLALDDGACAGRIWRGEGVHVRVLKGLRLVELVILVTISVVRDTPLDCHFSAWSRPKPAPDPLPGPSVASGVIPTKGGRNGPVLATSGRASTGRWRSSPWKRCNHAPPRGRGQGAPRTARCIKTWLLFLLILLCHESGSTPHRYGVSGVRLVCGGGGPWLLVAWTRVVLCTPLGGLPLVCWPGFVRVSQSEDQSRPTPPGTLYTQCPRRSGAWTLTRPRGPSF